MRRCFDLALLGAQHAAPNPTVGAALVYQGRIIGEGYHRVYGKAHAEVNAVNSVKAEDKPYISQSTMYVSLEPCNIHGRTPPCSDLILRHRIPRVVISYIDYTPGVDGSSITKLRAAGVEVVTHMLAEEGGRICAPRNVFISQHRPYIILKYAQSADGFFAPEENEQYWLSNAFSKRLVHRWRSEAKAILVGRATVDADNPQLNNRHYFGPSPLRIVLTQRGDFAPDRHLFTDGSPTWLFHPAHQSPLSKSKEIGLFPVQAGEDALEVLCDTLFQQKISTLMVEGGIYTLQRFIDRGLWDEARVLVSSHHMQRGRRAPTLPSAPEQIMQIGSDRLLFFRQELATTNR